MEIRTEPATSPAGLCYAGTVKPDVLIAGGGIIGCAAAFELAEAKLQVMVVERGEPGGEASWAAAGMLSPTAEHAEHPALAALARASAALYPQWLVGIARLSPVEVGYRCEGTLLVAFADAEGALLETVGGEKLTLAQARRLEPALSKQAVATCYLADDCQVDNRRLCKALRAAAARAGVSFHTSISVQSLLLESGRATGVRLSDGSTLAAGVVVNAAGCWAGQLGAESARLAPTRPVRGQMLALHGESAMLRHVVHSHRAYLVPRADGQVLVGSTMEEAGYDKGVTPEGLRGLLAGAREIAPTLAGLSFLEAWAGLRPDTPDHLPILGATDIKGYFIATGHFRNGILLAPITAKLLVAAILGRKPSLPLEPFSPLRFGTPRWTLE